MDWDAFARAANEYATRPPNSREMGTTSDEPAEPCARCGGSAEHNAGCPEICVEQGCDPLFVNGECTNCHRRHACIAITSARLSATLCGDTGPDAQRIHYMDISDDDLRTCKHGAVHLCPSCVRVMREANHAR